MIHGMALGVLHQFVGLLLYPVLAGLLIALLVLVWELGQFLGEATGILRRRFRHADLFARYAQTRLERVDLLARSGPILGLMGTLIPLGPGLSALGNGDLSQLATAMTVAFDTTVVGLVIGLLAYIVGRVRRRWFEHYWYELDAIEEKDNQDV